MSSDRDNEELASFWIKQAAYSRFVRECKSNGTGVEVDEASQLVHVANGNGPIETYTYVRRGRGKLALISHRQVRDALKALDGFDRLDTEIAALVSVVIGAESAA